MSDTNTTTYRSAIKQLVIVGVLLAVLLGLGLAYYLMTRPPALKGEGAGDKRFLFSIYGFEGDLLRRPSSVGVDAQGNIHVADTGKKRVVIFDKDGDYAGVYGEAGKGNLKLWDPIDVAVASDGRSFVIDKTQNKMVIFDRGHRATEEILFQDEAPLSVSIKDDSLFVTTESGVIVGSVDGQAQTGYIKRGKNPGEFDRPGAVAVGDDGTLYVADSLNYRVQAINTQGGPVWQYGKPIPADKPIQYQDPSRKFGLPAGITGDENGRLYVVDGLNSQIVVLNEEGEFQEVMADIGHSDGRLYFPDGIDYWDGRIVVADKFNDRVSVFQVPVPAGMAWTGYAPYALPLLLLPLLMLPFFRPARKIVATPDFLAALVADEDRATVLAAMKLAYLPEGQLALAGEVGEGAKWVGREPDQTRVDKLVERFELTREQAASVDVAYALKGKKVLVTNDPAVRDVADKLELPVVAYSEIKDLLSRGSRKPATAEGEE